MGGALAARDVDNEFPWADDRYLIGAADAAPTAEVVLVLVLVSVIGLRVGGWLLHTDPLYIKMF